MVNVFGDLIVLSAHRKPFFSDYGLGSDVERVVRHSPVPVLSAPSKQAEPASPEVETVIRAQADPLR